ncbi:MAG TPA: serine/threonine-protein kinase [Candidatus Limnocylindria bacterium]|nr:serine/threonine-protein kinase [Candidatus Limnocylindria bacterium]
MAHGSVRAAAGTVPASVADRFELQEQLGASSTAMVWRARDRKHRLTVCLKLLHPQLLDDPKARGRIRAEAEAAGTLEHPAIVSPLETIIDDESAAIVFPFVEGETLADRLGRDGVLPAATAARLCRDVADALAYAHSQGVVHRDVKPANILLDADERAHLLDFGIATTQTLAGLELTQPGTTVGTLAYMAPEQLAAAPAAPASDVYSLGAVLYQTLAGRRPYEAETPLAMAQAQQQPPAGLPEAPPALAALALMALNPDAAARPSAAAFSGSLRAWLEAMPMAPTTTLPAVDGTAVLAPVAAAAAPAGLPARQRAGLMMVLAVGALAVVVALGFAFSPGMLGGPLPDLGAPREPSPMPAIAPDDDDDNDADDDDDDAEVTTVNQPAAPAAKPDKQKGKDKNKGKGKGRDKDRDDD